MLGFEKRGKKIIELSWNHGIYFDAWSFVHILTGSMLAVLFIILGLSLVTGLIICFILMILYEGLKILKGIAEDLENLITDVVVGLLGFFFTYKIFIDQSLSNQWIFLVLFLLINAMLLYIGYEKYLKKRL
ncbi:MAG: hypothetical protein Q8P83_02025 [bacterium]|nr:hypothetical protein [bacterium]